MTRQIEWAVRFHSTGGSVVFPAKNREQAETWAALQASQSGYWAEVLTRTLPDWVVSKAYPNTRETDRG